MLDALHQPTITRKHVVAHQFGPNSRATVDPITLMMMISCLHHPFQALVKEFGMRFCADVAPGLVVSPHQVSKGACQYGTPAH